MSQTGNAHQTAVAHWVNVVWARQSGPHDDSAYALLRTEVARALRVEPRDVRLAKMCGQCGSDEHGKPYVVRVGETAPPYVSISRAGSLTMVAVTYAGPVGVDVEASDAPSFAGFNGVALHPDEMALSIRDRAIAWVRKESLLKATGDGLTVDPRSIRISDPGHPPRLLEWEGDGRPLGPVQMYDVQMRDVQMYDAQAGSSHVACVSVLSNMRPELSVREAAREDLLPPASP